MICPVCGARMDSARPWALARGCPYFRCRRCSYIRLHPDLLPTPRAEKDRYSRHRNDPEDPGYRAYLDDFITRAVRPYAEAPARILDFGSGPVPALSVLLSARGYRVRSYDPFFAPDRSALRGAFDLIAVHEVAEHLRFPFREFSRLSLAPGGRLAVRTRYAPETPAEFERWWYREDPTHVGFFGSRSLAALAERLGMRLEADDGREMAVLGAPPLPGRLNGGPVPPEPAERRGFRPALPWRRTASGEVRYRSAEDVSASGPDPRSSPSSALSSRMCAERRTSP